MKMTIVPRDDDITHVVLSGRLDSSGAEAISDQLAEAIGDPPRATIVDMSKIEFLGSPGLGLLMATSKRFRPRRVITLPSTPIIEPALTRTRRPAFKRRSTVRGASGSVPGAACPGSRPSGS